LQTYLYVIQLILAAALIGILLLQAKGSSMGGLFGGSDSAIYNTRRGVEKTLFQVTVALSVVFLLFSFVVVVFSRA